jgi:hypothetical protein
MDAMVKMLINKKVAVSVPNHVPNGHSKDLELVFKSLYGDAKKAGDKVVIFLAEGNLIRIVAQ